MSTPRPSGTLSTGASGFRALRSLVPLLAACLMAAPVVAGCFHVRFQS
jgi:hypothetical protein